MVHMGSPGGTSEILPRGVIYNALSESFAWKQLFSKDVIKFENQEAKVLPGSSSFYILNMNYFILPSF